MFVSQTCWRILRCPRTLLANIRLLDFKFSGAPMTKKKVLKLGHQAADRITQFYKVSPAQLVLDTILVTRLRNFGNFCRFYLAHFPYLKPKFLCLKPNTVKTKGVRISIVGFKLSKNLIEMITYTGSTRKSTHRLPFLACNNILCILQFLINVLLEYHSVTCAKDVIKLCEILKN
jgi:hypothetical protein